MSKSKTPLGHALLDWEASVRAIRNLLERGATREELLTYFKIHWTEGEWVTRLLRDAGVDMSEVKKKP